MRYSSGRLSGSLGQQRRASGLLIEATTRSGLITSAIEPGSIGRLESCQDRAKIAMIKVVTRLALSLGMARQCKARI